MGPEIQVIHVGVNKAIRRNMRSQSVVLNKGKKERKEDLYDFKQQQMGLYFLIHTALELNGEVVSSRKKNKNPGAYFTNPWFVEM